MKITLDPANPQTWPKGRVNVARLDATAGYELVAQQACDDTSAMKDASNYAALVSQFLEETRRDMDSENDAERT